MSDKTPVSVVPCLETKVFSPAPPGKVYTVRTAVAVYLSPSIAGTLSDLVGETLADFPGIDQIDLPAVNISDNQESEEKFCHDIKQNHFDMITMIMNKIHNGEE